MSFNNKDMEYDEIVKMLAKDGMALKQLDKKDQTEDLIIIALQNTLDAFQYVDKKFSKSKSFIMRVIKETPWALYGFKFASADIIKDEDFVVEGVKCDGEVVAYAGGEFKNRIDLARLALNAKRHSTLEYFGEGVKANKKFMLEVLAERPEEYKNLSIKLKNDTAFLAEAVKVNSKIWNFIPKEMVDIVKDYIVSQLQSKEVLEEEVIVG